MKGGDGLEIKKGRPGHKRGGRVFETEVPKHVEKVELKEYYRLTEKPRQVFVKYLLDLKMTEALAVAGFSRIML